MYEYSLNKILCWNVWIEYRTYRIPNSIFDRFLKISICLFSCAKISDLFIEWFGRYRILNKFCSLGIWFWARILLKLFQALKVFKLRNLFYIQTLVMSMDVSKIILVHFEEVLKDSHTKKSELLKRGGWTKNPILAPLF